MTVYDCSIFLNENDLFEIKLNQHWNFVDKFIIVEAGETHTGFKKPLNFDHKRFEQYASKIIYATFDSLDEEMLKYPELNCPIGRQIHGNHIDWARDHFQMNYFKKVLDDQGAKDDDLIFFACLDEIIKEDAFYSAASVFQDKDAMYNTYNWTNGQPYAVGTLRPCFGFNLDYYSYKFNALRLSHTSGYIAANITEFSNFKKILPGSLRSMCLATHPHIRNAGWHFSFADNTNGEMVFKKMQSWAHSRDVFPDGRRRCDVKTPEEAVQFMLTEYGMSIPECIVPVTLETHPAHLVNNQEKFKDFILKL
jgi:beta-1,4-mannosyl-glycoprotein beta-1,4-N-acetylglucosaminyltransferase